MAPLSQNRYNLEKRLGAGAMGEVWMATDTLLNRPVAVKYLKATDDERVKNLFLSEARTLASLHHPNITLIYDAVFDEEENRFYLVMEYVDGETLSNIINGWDGPLPLEITLDLIIGVVEALEYAHNHGIVHRDIKPANVMIQKDAVKLTDFGIAGLISLLASGSDFIIGTPAYISPEQIDGGKIDGRSDLYSLGIILYEMTSGQGRPFKYATQTKLFMAHLQEEPPNLKNIRPDIPLAMERTIMRLLAKNPNDRFDSTTELLDVLRSIRARLQFSQPHLQFLDPEEKPFVGRNAELKQIETVWADIQETATPRLVVVKGETGIGKTRLITEFLGWEIVDEGLIAVAGRCDEAGVPYAPYAEILGTILNRNLTKSLVGQSKIDDLIEQIPSLGRLLNITDKPKAKKDDTPKEDIQKSSSTSGLWQMLSQRVPDNTTSDIADTQWQFSQTVADILGDVGETVLFLEDTSYLDEASIALTRSLIRQSQLPVLLIAAYRNDAQTPTWFDSFAANEKFVLTVPPLATSDIKTYLQNLAGGEVSDDVVALIEGRSRGNPLQIEEFTRQLIDSAELKQDEQGMWQHIQPEKLADAFLPEAVLGAFTRNIDKLSESSREALALAALLEPGPEFEFAMWVGLLDSEMPGYSAQAALDEGLKRRLLRQLDDKRYNFRPADISKALAATLTGSRRADLHEKIAGILHNAGVDPLLVGYHHEQAGSPTKAARYLQVAAAKAISTNAPSAALTYYQRAATLLESRSIYRAIGDIERQRGNHVDAINAYQHTIMLAKKAGDIEEEAKTLNSLALTYCLSNQYEAAHQYAEQVLKLESVSEAEQAVAQSQLGLILWLSGQLVEAEGWCQKAIITLSKTDHQSDLATTYYRLGQIYLSQGKFNKARIALQECLKLRRALADDIGEARCLGSLGRLVGERSDFKQAHSLFDAARERFTQSNHQEGLVEIYIQRGQLWVYEQQPAKALTILTKALETTKRINEGRTHILGTIYRLLAQAHLIRGEADIAKSIADDALKLVEEAKSREHIALCQATLAEIYVVREDFRAAQIMYKDALKLFEQVGSLPGTIRTKLSYAQLLKRQGQAFDAATMIQDAHQAAAQIELYVPPI